MERKTTELMKREINPNGQTLGYRESGGIFIHQSTPYLVRHSSLRFRDQRLGSKFVIENDIEKINYPLAEIPKRVTKLTCDEHLSMLANGILPDTNTVGVEIEGVMYDKDFHLKSSHDPIHNPLETDPHPELNHFTLERATGLNNGSHLKGILELSQSLGQTITEAYELANATNSYYVLSSTPEGGNWSDGKLTDIAYLRQYAPFIKKHAYDGRSRIPQESREMYEGMGINLDNELSSNSDLNWPMNALHIHNGLPTYYDGGSEVIDTRIAIVNAYIRHTKFAKLIGTMLYSTVHFYSTEHNVYDTRQIAKRALATTHNDAIPYDELEFCSDSISQVERGLIPNVNRYPQDGQHSRVRIRNKTVETIGYPISPDLRAVVATCCATSIMDTIAKEALSATDGDEKKAIEYLKTHYGDSMSHLQSLGKNSDHEWDVQLNSDGPQSPEVSNLLETSLNIIDDMGNKYIAHALDAKILKKVLSASLSQKSGDGLDKRLGLNEAQSFDTKIQYTGLVSEYKHNQPIPHLIKMQHNATKSQAEYLANVQTEQDILHFVGY